MNEGTLEISNQDSFRSQKLAHLPAICTSLSWLRDIIGKESSDIPKIAYNGAIFKYFLWFYKALHFPNNQFMLHLNVYVTSSVSDTIKKSQVWSYDFT